MGPFLVILLGSTLSFAVIFQKINDIQSNQSIDQDVTKFYIQFKKSYKLATMGDFDDFEEEIDKSINFIIFMFACLFQLIVMLNLLIAIISDTFDKVQENKTSSDCKERCALMREVEEF